VEKEVVARFPTRQTLCTLFASLAYHVVRDRADVEGVGGAGLQQ
jgi:hypothetical protein